MTGRRVDITVDEIVLTGLRVADPAGFADAVGTRLARLVGERGLPQEREPGPVTVRLAAGTGAAAGAGDEALHDALAEAIWSGIGQGGAMA
jgi:hypothetical protein